VRSASGCGRGRHGVKGPSTNGPIEAVKLPSSESSSSVSKLRLYGLEWWWEDSKKFNRGDEGEEHSGDEFSDALERPGRLNEEPGSIWPLSWEGEAR